MTDNPMDVGSARKKFIPTVPDDLKDIAEVSLAKMQSLSLLDSSLSDWFPHLKNLHLLRIVKSPRSKRGALRVGVVFSGGQASGGHNVITGLFDAIKSIHEDSVLFGFLAGPSGIIQGNYVEIHSELLASFRNQGGFDLIGSGREKIESEDQLRASLSTVKKLDLQGLVIIGGDDSNTNAAHLSEYFLSHAQATSVIGVPKTIDGDLQNTFVPISFGFDTACKIYSEMISNIARDALSSKKYYHFIKLMGRSASHIALECALSTQVNYTLIGEEVAKKRLTLSQIVKDIADMICSRALQKKQYGVILIPEGLIEFIPEIKRLISEINAYLAKSLDTDKTKLRNSLSKDSMDCFDSIPQRIQEQMFMERDPHGNVQVSFIETEKLIFQAVQQELKKRKEEGLFKGSFHPVQHFFGYEGRAGLPTEFDTHYCYALGRTAAILIRDEVTGYMCFVDHLDKEVSLWKAGGIPLLTLMHKEVRHGKEKPVVRKALVDLDGKAFKYFSHQRESWRDQDAYAFPGPIQFYGPKEICFSIPQTVKLNLS
ncbi:MAG: diphosphate--fructose-6-phosphate 1-phosphotransferase [Chlamydiae bacterium]|nr:diphosphate--fructose-6-phosphate 1-phosphotransferase [Chlamydiota bacterium]